MEFVRRVYENGKLTIPKEIREVHDIREGDLVRLEVVEVLRADATTDSSKGARSSAPISPAKEGRA